MISVMHMAVFLVTTVLAATPAYYFLRRTKQGRARGAIAYLSGFLFGIIAFALLPTPDPMLSKAALLAAFFGPFVGISRARYMRLRRERLKERHKDRRKVHREKALNTA